jgi:hypothetical protein
MRVYAFLDAGLFAQLAADLAHAGQVHWAARLVAGK